MVRISNRIITVLIIVILIKSIIFSNHLYGVEKFNLNQWGEQISSPILDRLTEKITLSHNFNQSINPIDTQSENYTIFIRDISRVNVGTIDIHDQNIIQYQIYPNLGIINVRGIKSYIEAKIQNLGIESFKISTTIPIQYSIRLDSDHAPLKVNVDVSSNTSQIYNLNGYQLNLLSDASGIRIGIVDNGVDLNHPALNNLIIHQENFNGVNPVGIQSHGTSVVSVIGGKDGSNILGIATGATIYSASMGSPLYESGTIGGDFYAAFDYLIANNVSIINTSFGGPTKIWSDIVNQLNNLGIILVGSAGNDYISGNDDEFSISGPGSHQHAISIAGTDESNSYWDGSLEGPNMNGISKPDFVAQAKNVYTAWYDSNNIVQRDGTSFSSPLVTGGIASILQLMKARNMEYNTAIIKSILGKNSNSITTSKGVNQGGFGIPDLYLAAQDIINNTTGSIFITPYQAPEYFYQHHLRNSTQNLDLNFFTSLTAEEIDFTINGNITDIVKQTGNITLNSQLIPIQIKSNSTTQYGQYTGNITLYSINNNSINRSSSIFIVVDRDKVGEVMVDFRYSDYDTNWYDRVNSEIPWNEKYGPGTGKLIDLLWKEGLQVKFNDQDLSSSLLSNIDVLILLDFIPTSFYYDSFDELVINAYTVETEGIIKQFVDDGGSLYVDFNGYIGSTTSESVHSNNIFGIQSLLSVYNIKAFEYPMSTQDFLSRDQIYYLNESNSISSADRLDYSGNFLEKVDYNNLKTLATYELSPTINSNLLRNHLFPALFYDQLNAGRVAVLSSTIHRNNCALGTDASFCTSSVQYPNAIDDQQFVKDLFHWLIGRNRTIISDVEINSTSVVVTLQSHDIGIVSLYKINDSGNHPVSNYISINGTTKEYFIPNLSDQVLDLELNYGGKHQKKKILVDIESPNIQDSQDTSIQFGNEDVLVFTVEDMFYVSSEVQVDDIPYTNIDEIDLGNGTVAIYVYLYTLTGTNHEVTITAYDTKQSSTLRKTFFLALQTTSPKSTSTRLGTGTTSVTTSIIDTTSANYSPQNTIKQQQTNQLRVGLVEASLITIVIGLIVLFKRKQ